MNKYVIFECGLNFVCRFLERLIAVFIYFLARETKYNSFKMYVICIIVAIYETYFMYRVRGVSQSKMFCKINYFLDQKNSYA